MVGKRNGVKITCQATTVPADDRVPDMGKRQLMNLLLLGAVSLPTAGMLVPYATFFAPPGLVLRILFPLVLFPWSFPLRSHIFTPIRSFYPLPMFTVP